jgi:hypothetical protein
MQLWLLLIQHANGWYEVDCLPQRLLVVDPQLAGIQFDFETTA